MENRYIGRCRPRGRLATRTPGSSATTTSYGFAATTFRAARSASATPTSGPYVASSSASFVAAAGSGGRRTRGNEPAWTLLGPGSGSGWSSTWAALSRPSSLPTTPRRCSPRSRRTRPPRGSSTAAAARSSSTERPLSAQPTSGQPGLAGRERFHGHDYTRSPRVPCLLTARARAKPPSASSAAATTTPTPSHTVVVRLTAPESARKVRTAPPTVTERRNDRTATVAAGRDVGLTLFEGRWLQTASAWRAHTRRHHREPERSCAETQRTGARGDALVATGSSGTCHAGSPSSRSPMEGEFAVG